MAVDGNGKVGEWILTFIPRRELAALNRYMVEETKFESQSVARRHAFQDWRMQMGYVSPNESDLRLN
jgi:hypothetical protein